MSGLHAEAGATRARHPTDEALELQEEWLRVALSSIGDAVITTDNRSNITFLNPVAQSLTGWTPEDAVGKPLDAVFNIIHETTRHPVEDPVAQALREGVAVGLANHPLLIAKDGTERSIDDSAAPIRNAAGKVVGVVLVFRDVTERRRQTRMAQEIEAVSGTLASIVESSGDSIISTTLEGNITSWNRSAEKLFGYTKAEAIGLSIFAIIPDERRSEEEEVLARVRRGEKVEHFETDRKTKDGGRLNISLTVSPIHAASGQVIGTSRIARDNTERKQTRLQLEVSETRFRCLFEAAHDGILILDAENHKITHVNPFLVRLLGFPAQHFLGKELWEIGVLSDRQASQSAMGRLGREGSIRYESLPLEDCHGHKHPVEMIANLYQEDHHPVIQCNIRDISERSRLETLQRGQAAELSELHRRKDEFLAMLSHELRSPLAPIANAVQLLGLERGSENRIQRQARGIIERQLKQLQHLVDDLLEVSRITTGRVQLRREPAIVSDIVEGAVETVRPLLEQRRHEFTVSLPPEPIWLHADVSRLEQVLVNLLTNAAKYTAMGGHVWLNVQRQGDQCVLRVGDTGVGIAPELLPRIFDLFTQSERSLDRCQGGLGIGLALVQRLTELHEGQVEAHSVVGEGSEFVVRLPVMSTEPRPEARDSETGQTPTHSLRVLVVDDNVDTVLSFSMLLKTLGHEVRTAHDGPSAVQAALDGRPDVVLLDIGLPGLNGYEVAKRIRQQPSLQQVVLVAVTGYGQEADRQTALQAGFTHHMVKPVRLAQLQQILATVSEHVT